MQILPAGKKPGRYYREGDREALGGVLGSRVKGAGLNLALDDVEDEVHRDQHRYHGLTPPDVTLRSSDSHLEGHRLEHLGHSFLPSTTLELRVRIAICPDPQLAMLMMPLRQLEPKTAAGRRPSLGANHASGQGLC
eukprot:765641-Rhodomonas_salina.3